MIVRIALPGDWDISRREELRGLLRPNASAAELVIDMSETKFVDASVLGVLVTLVNARSGFPKPYLRIEGASSQIRRIIELTKLEGALVLSGPEKTQENA